MEVDIKFFLELLEQLMEAWQVVRARSPHLYFLMLAAEHEKLHQFVLILQVYLIHIGQLIDNLPDDIGQSQYNVLDSRLHGIKNNRDELLLHHLRTHQLKYLRQYLNCLNPDVCLLIVQ